MYAPPVPLTLQMYACVRDVLEAFPGRFEGVPAAQRAADAFLEAEASIRRALASGERLPETGKQGRWQRMADAVVVLAQTLSAWADETERFALSETMNLQETDLLMVTEREAIVTSEEVLGAARDYLDQLADYGVSERMLVDVEAALLDFAATLNEPERPAAPPVAPISLTTAFDDIDRLLTRRLDPLVHRYKGTPFFERYQAARSIVD